MVVRARNSLQSPLHKTSRLRLLGNRLRDFSRAEGGAAAVYFVLSAPVWIAGLGLGAEVGSWYFFQQNLQSTADAVADSLAGRVGTGASSSELSNFANYLLTQNKFDSASGTSSFSISSSGPVFVDGATVNVTLTKSVRRYLTGFFQPGSFEIKASATAQVHQATQGCVLSLAKSGAGRLSVTASANVQVTGCEVLANSLAAGAFAVTAGSSLITDCARTGGTFNIQGQLSVLSCRQREDQAGFTLDPYVQDYPEPNLSDLPCNNDGTAFTWSQPSVTPNFGTLANGVKFFHFCNGATLEIVSTMDIGAFTGASIFIFNNSFFRIKDTNITVTSYRASFYFINGGKPEIYAPNARVNLLAPTSGSYKGMLFRGSVSNTSVSNNQIVVGPGSYLKGAIYFPASQVIFRASGALNGCLHIIGNSVMLIGTWQATGPCPNSAGTRPIVASRKVQLTQ